MRASSRPSSISSYSVTWSSKSETPAAWTKPRAGIGRQRYLAVAALHRQAAFHDRELALGGGHRGRAREWQVPAEAVVAGRVLELDADADERLARRSSRSSRHRSATVAALRAAPDRLHGDGPVVASPDDEARRGADRPRPPRSPRSSGVRPGVVGRRSVVVAVPEVAAIDEPPDAGQLGAGAARRMVPSSAAVTVTSPLREHRPAPRRPGSAEPGSDPRRRSRPSCSRGAAPDRRPAAGAGRGEHDTSQIASGRGRGGGATPSISSSTSSSGGSGTSSTRRVIAGISARDRCAPVQLGDRRARDRAATPEQLG